MYGTFGVFHCHFKLVIFQYYTRWYHRCSLWAYHTDANMHSIPHTMFPSLLPVGISHRRPLHPHSFNTIASTRAWPSTPVAGTLVVGTMYLVSSMAVDVPLTMLSSLLPVGLSHRRPLHPQSCIAPPAGRKVVVEFEHTLPATRSHPPGVWRVMAYDISSSAVT